MNERISERMRWMYAFHDRVQWWAYERACKAVLTARIVRLKVSEGEDVSDYQFKVVDEPQRI